MTPLAAGQLLPASYNVSSVLDARLRRESRRSRMVINNARLNLEDYNKQQKSSSESVSPNMKPVIVEQKLTDFENVRVFSQELEFLTSGHVFSPQRRSRPGCRV